MEDALESAIGFEVTTFVRTAAELKKAVDRDPFEVAAGDTYFITFLRRHRRRRRRQALEAASNDFDTLVVDGRDVHWRMHGKSTDTKLPSKTWKLVGEHGSTSRNANLLRTLVAKLRATLIDDGRAVLGVALFGNRDELHPRTSNRSLSRHNLDRTCQPGAA